MLLTQISIYFMELKWMLSLKQESMTPLISPILGLINYLALLFSGYHRNDRFTLDFKYTGSGLEVNLFEENLKQESENHSTKKYDLPRVDVLTAIIQALTDMKKGKKTTDAIEVKLVDKTGGPLTGEITVRENKAAITIKEDSDFKNMAVVLSKEIEPQEIYMKELYRLADVEAFRRTKVD